MDSISQTPVGRPGFVTFGWAAPPFAEQVPEVSKESAEKFDAFNKAIILLHLHEIITDGERDKAIKRTTKQIDQAIRAARGK